MWEKLDSVSKSIAEEPWSLYWNEMKSEEPEFKEFISNPIPVLVEQTDEVEADYRIQTTIINHEVGLMGSMVCQAALVDPDSRTVYLTLYKHR